MYIRVCCHQANIRNHLNREREMKRQTYRSIIQPTEIRKQTKNHMTIRLMNI